MKKLKVVTVVGTRPEIIRLSRLIPKLDKYTDHVLVHTGQNYDPQLSDVFFKDLELRKPDYYLNVETSSFGSVMGDTIKRSEEVFLKERPDAVMILGDTNSAVAAIVAERLKIPVYHMEAGNRSFDYNVPEELNRKMIDHVATFNLPYTEHARRNLLSEGIHPRLVALTGSPIREIFEHYQNRVERSDILERLNLKPNGFLLLSLHRQETVDSPERLNMALNAIVSLREELNLEVLVSTHPRTRTKLEEISSTSLPGFIFHEPFGYLDYSKLQLSAHCVISDSGTVSEESAIMGFPAVTLRDSIERPESLESASVILCPISAEMLLSGVVVATKRAHGHSSVPPEYEVRDFSDRVLGFLMSTAMLHRKWRGLERGV